MLKINQRLEQAVKTDLTIKLTFEIRQKSRFKTQLNDGTEVGVFLPRGNVLRNGDCLKADDGRIIGVLADDEQVSTVTTNDQLLLSRACYHLGNRHVALQIDENKISYLHDHVLDDMLKGLGLTVDSELSPFEPENGAYAQHSHGQHSHAQDGDSHSHSHSHH